MTSLTYQIKIKYSDDNFPQSLYSPDLRKDFIEEYKELMKSVPAENLPLINNIETDHLKVVLEAYISNNIEKNYIIRLPDKSKKISLKSGEKLISIELDIPLKRSKLTIIGIALSVIVNAFVDLLAVKSSNSNISYFALITPMLNNLLMMGMVYADNYILYKLDEVVRTMGNCCTKTSPQEKKQDGKPIILRAIAQCLLLIPPIGYTIYQAVSGWQDIESTGDKAIQNKDPFFTPNTILGLAICATSINAVICMILSSSFTFRATDWLTAKFNKICKCCNRKQYENLEDVDMSTTEQDVAKPEVEIEIEDYKEEISVILQPEKVDSDTNLSPVAGAWTRGVSENVQSSGMGF